MDARALVLSAQSGDLEAREALARAWLPAAYGAALSVLGRAADAEDAAQDGFLKAFAALGTLRSPERFGPWLLKIVRNSARDLLRRRRPVQPADDEVAGASDGESVGGGALPLWRRLPEDERLVVWLNVVQGIPFRDIAALLGTSKSAVDRTYRRALTRMRKEMARC